MQVGILGASGRLGKLVVELLTEESIKTTAISRKDLESKNTFQNALLKFTSGYVLLDVSLPEGTQRLLDVLSSLPKQHLEKIHGLIIGTTGHSLAQKKKIADLAQNIPICLVSNFSKGVFLFEQILTATTHNGKTVADLARALGFDLALNEIHHTLKKDAPSGTAITIAEAAKLSGDKISAVRVGKVVGEHTLYFSQDSEMLEIKHSAYNRKLFASGAAQLCKNIFTKKPNAGLISKDDFFT